MAVNLVRSARLFADTGYAYAAKASAGDLIFTAGACPLDKQGKVVAPGDLIAQTRQALANLRTALEDSGAAIEDVVKTTVYVASSDRGELAAAFDEVAAFFGDHDVPSTLLGVAVLGYAGQLVEIEAIAVHLAAVSGLAYAPRRPKLNRYIPAARCGSPPSAGDFLPRPESVPVREVSASWATGGVGLWRGRRGGCRGSACRIRPTLTPGHGWSRTRWRPMREPSGHCPSPSWPRCSGCRRTSGPPWC